MGAKTTKQIEVIAGGKGQKSVTKENCQVCQTPVPDIFEMPYTEDPLEALQSRSEHHTKCYFVYSKDEITVGTNQQVGFELGMEAKIVGSAGRSKSVRKGMKAVIFMRKVDSPGEYLCCHCFRKKYPQTMRGVFMELHNKATFLFCDVKMDELYALDQD